MSFFRYVKNIINSILEPLGVEIIRAKNKSYELDIYEDNSKPITPKYVNIGAGDFFHPYWHNLDTPNEYYADRQKGRLQILHDLTSNSPLPFEDSSLSIVYTSHVIEHISNKHVTYLFDEVYRCLKPGGVFRITCPDIDLELDAFLRRDELFWRAPNAYGVFNNSIEQAFLDHFASSLTVTHPYSKFNLSDDDVKRIFLEMDKEKALDFIIDSIPLDMINKYPGDHVNWFNCSKLFLMLTKSNFININKSGYGQSRSAILRNTRLFDSTCPNLSLYVECTK